MCFVHFDLQINVLLATAACHFSTSQLPKMVRTCCALYILTCKCASRYSGVQFFITEPTFRPSRPTNHWKNTAFRDFPNISRVWIFFLLAFHNCIFFLLTLVLFSAFHLLTLLLCSAFSISSEVRLLNFL